MGTVQLSRSDRFKTDFGGGVSQSSCVAVNGGGRYRMRERGTLCRDEEASRITNSISR